MPGERLQKVLAEAGLASRRQAEQWIREGRVAVNGTLAVLGQRVEPRDEIRVDGRPVRQLRRPPARRQVPDSVWLCHRSPGDDLQQGLIPRLPRRAGRRFVAISPMPRVDGGLELLTSDGALAARLQRRVRDSIAQFSVRIRGDLNDAGRAAVLQGMLDDGSVLEIESLEASGEEGDASNRWYHIGARGPSGKAIRQLFERQGVIVSRVMRTALGELQLTRDLGRGHFRLLLPEEAARLDLQPAVAETAATVSGPARSAAARPGVATRARAPVAGSRASAGGAGPRSRARPTTGRRSSRR
ncbi:MAG: rRNA pseudouridine synthase [Sinobacteraceae bacterium]|nr:rRNA pseudouridine synthase [Nevskiaceae bacterium]MCP5359930.1 rRNA pseudouridine synthase [Nevskiaceae bacterium]MCP5467505.1 rRNA pseudouridine synthase [Nevskiaceae bacterium]